MKIKDFIIKTHKDDKFIQRPRIVCTDGFSMSVQGSEYHYCSPRSLQDFYTSMEIGFPSKKEPLILEWAEERKKPKQTVYGCVPCEVIDQVIEKHGGIDEDKTFPIIEKD